MSKVLVVNSKRLSDVIIFESKEPDQADLHWCEVNQASKEKGDLLWFFVDQPTDATIKVYWTDKHYEADIIAYKVNQPHEAKWLKANKFIQHL